MSDTLLQSIIPEILFPELIDDLNLEILEIPVPEISQGAQALTGNSGLSPLVNVQPPSLLTDFDAPDFYPKSKRFRRLPLLTDFDAANFDTNVTNTGRLVIPPDPYGAAGPKHLVNVVNVSIEWYNKGGVQQNSQSLQSFFSDLLPGTDEDPQTFTFDPKVIYDQYSDRFVAVTLEQQGRGDGDPNNDQSYIFLAVSDDSDPNGTWYAQRLPGLVDIGGINHWADYPGFAIDEEAIYITNNMFSFDSPISYGGSRLWIVDKGERTGGLYDGGTSGFSVNNPYAEAGIATTTQPAHIFGKAPEGVGTFLVSYSGLTTGVDEAVQVVRVDDPLGTPKFTQEFVFVGDIDDTSVFPLPDAPQLGSDLGIETNDRRALNAVWRDDSLFLTAQVVPNEGPDAGQVTAHWWELDTTNPDSLVVNQQGNVGGEEIAPGTHTFFPSIAVNKKGDIGIGFSASAPSIFAGAYYTGRKASDPLGTVRPPEVLREGLDFYERTFGGSRNRWGDYSSIAVDPRDDSTFWVYNEYASTRGTTTNSPTGIQDGRWATAYGRFAVGPLDYNYLDSGLTPGIGNGLFDGSTDVL